MHSWEEGRWFLSHVGARPELQVSFLCAPHSFARSDARQLLPRSLASRWNGPRRYPSGRSLLSITRPLCDAASTPPVMDAGER